MQTHDPPSGINDDATDEARICAEDIRYLNRSTRPGDTDQMDKFHSRKWVIINDIKDVLLGMQGLATTSKNWPLVVPVDSEGLKDMGLERQLCILDVLLTKEECEGIIRLKYPKQERPNVAFSRL